MSLSKNQLKLLHSLQQKKYITKHGLFIAEGVKVVDEFLKADFELEHLFYTHEISYVNIEKSTLITTVELKKVSSLKTPNKVLALFKIPREKTLKNNGLIVALDAVNDPGNLGTIIRLCDWFGVSELVCSTHTVDCYNAKVVQAAMGSLARVSVAYVSLETYLQNATLPKYATTMEGENVYRAALPKQAILVMGNEANGISDTVLNLLDQQISIPRFGELQQTESLNVATATAILLSEFRR